METDEGNNDCEEKGCSEMQTMPNDPYASIPNESDESKRIVSSAQDEQKILPPPAALAENHIDIAMEATEISTHLQTAHDIQISDPDISKTEQHESVVADQLEKDNFVIGEVKEISEVNRTDGSMDLESRTTDEKDNFVIGEVKEISEVNRTDGSMDLESKTTDENVKEENFRIDFTSGDFLYQASGSWAEFDQDDDCFLKGCKWLVI